MPAHRLRERATRAFSKGAEKKYARPPHTPPLRSIDFPIKMRDFQLPEVELTRGTQVFPASCHG